jgi:hypothetical protein
MKRKRRFWNKNTEVVCIKPTSRLRVGKTYTVCRVTGNGYYVELFQPSGDFEVGSFKRKRSNNKEYCTSTGIIDLECCAENCNGGCIYQDDEKDKRK